MQVSPINSILPKLIIDRISTSNVVVKHRVFANRVKKFVRMLECIPILTWGSHLHHVKHVLRIRILTLLEWQLLELSSDWRFLDLTESAPN